jgi:arylsulfatase A-like enzyme
MHPSSRSLRYSRVAVLLAAAGCGGGSSPQPTPTPPTNVLLVVLDDWGVDMFAPAGVHPDAPALPNLEALAASGVYFRRAYVAPTCSPTRAQILTGRYGFRTGIGEPIAQWQSVPALNFDEVTLAEVLDNAAPRPVATSAIGKWHLGSVATGDADHPNLQGFDWFEGTLGNLFFGQRFDDYTKVTNGVSQSSTTYATTEQVDDALERIAAMPQPWFVCLGFNAAHQPFHAPPAQLHSYALSGDPDATPNLHYKAALEAIDTELGRLFASLPDAVRSNTTIVVLGDNGTPNEAVTPPAVEGQNKGSLFEGGVRTPLIVAGKQVAQPGRTSDALVHAVDLFATLAELLETDFRAGVGDNRPIDSLSFAELLRNPAAAPPRSDVFHERFSPNGPGPYVGVGWMVRDVRWKLIRRDGQPDSFFDMLGLELEGAQLDLTTLDPEQQAAYDALVARLAAILAS